MKAEAKFEKQLTTSEVSSRIGFSKTQVRRMIARECFPRAWQLEDGSGQWRVPEGDVSAFLRKRQR